MKQLKLKEEIKGKRIVGISNTGSQVCIFLEDDKYIILEGNRGWDDNEIEIMRQSISMMAKQQHGIITEKEWADYKSQETIQLRDYRANKERAELSRLKAKYET